MRRKFICGNWKMYKTPSETRDFLNAFLPLVRNDSHLDIGLAVPFTSLEGAAALAREANVKIGGQNVHWEREGAFTGEISPPMLKAAGASFALIGHSERRQYFGETDETVSRRTKAALAEGITAVVCVGETLAERDRGDEVAVVCRQLSTGLQSLSPKDWELVTVAYEPVWAIGTGRTATSEEAERMHQEIRAEIKKFAGEEASKGVRILYGGSVKPSNSLELLTQENVDGALVGGASLDAETFASIVHFQV